MWYYEGEELKEIPDGVIGFVYLITDLTTGKKYVGKKNVFSTRRIKVKGKTKRKRVVSESDWQDYYGSNTILQEEVAQRGGDCFRREILHFCRSKAMMSYLEIKEQIEREVLFKPNEYFNNFVGCRIHRKHLK